MFTEMDDGTGVCIHYDRETRKCQIYESRPLICNVDRFYETYLQDKMSREEFYEMNYAACRRMQENK